MCISASGDCVPKFLQKFPLAGMQHFHCIPASGTVGSGSHSRKRRGGGGGVQMFTLIKVNKNVVQFLSFNVVNVFHVVVRPMHV